MNRLTRVRFAPSAVPLAAGQSRAPALLLLLGSLQRTPAHP